MVAKSVSAWPSPSSDAFESNIFSTAFLGNRRGILARLLILKTNFAYLLYSIKQKIKFGISLSLLIWLLYRCSCLVKQCKTSAFRADKSWEVARDSRFEHKPETKYLSNTYLLPRSAFSQMPKNKSETHTLLQKRGKILKMTNIRNINSSNF